MAKVSIQISDWETIRNDPYYHDIINGYADECAIEGMPRPKPDGRVYQQLINNGVMFPFTARIHPFLIGFIALLVTPNPHYGCLIGTVESFYVLPEHRSSGAGLQLLARARQHATTLGAKGLLVSAPADGTLSAVLDGMNFMHTNEVFFKPL